MRRKFRVEVPRPGITTPVAPVFAQQSVFVIKVLATKGMDGSAKRITTVTVAWSNFLASDLVKEVKLPDGRGVITTF